MKICSKCKVEKPLSEFSEKAGRPENKHYYCRVCKLEHDRAYRERNKHRLPELSKKSRIKRVYGLDWEVYLEMSKDGCNICHRDDVRLYVDHDHNCCPQQKDGNAKTCGKCVRGILCMNCNSAIGSFRDSEELLNSAINYVKKR